MSFVADDPNRDEETTELNPSLWKLYLAARTNAEGWTAEADRLKLQVMEQMAGASAATVDGAKVAYHRPTSRYAEARLIKDHPALTAHFMRKRSQEFFDLEAFLAQHGEIAEQYRVRSFRVAGVQE